MFATSNPANGEVCEVKSTAFPPRQYLRPAMRPFPSVTVQVRDPRCGAAHGGDLREGCHGAETRDNVAILAPGAARFAADIAQGNDGTTFHGDLLHLGLVEESY